MKTTYQNRLNLFQKKNPRKPKVEEENQKSLPMASRDTTRITDTNYQAHNLMRILSIVHDLLIKTEEKERSEFLLSTGYIGITSCGNLFC